MFNQLWHNSLLPLLSLIARWVGPLASRNELLDAPLELRAHEKHFVVALYATHPNVGSHTHDAPIVASAGVRFPQGIHIPYAYIHRLHRHGRVLSRCKGNYNI